MASSGSFCKWTTNLGIKDDGTRGIVTNYGDMEVTHTHNGIATIGDMAVSSGKWYWETYYRASADFSDNALILGWQSLKQDGQLDFAYIRQQPGSGLGAPDRPDWGSHLVFFNNTSTAFGGGHLSSINNVNGSYSGANNDGLKVTAACVIGCAIDIDNNRMYWAKDGTWYEMDAENQTASSTTLSSVNGWEIESTWRGGKWTPAAWFSGASTGSIAVMNSGQDSTFAGTKSTGTANAADENGHGDFYYTPPSGFLAMCTANLHISEDIDPAKTDTDFGAKQFGVVTWTGDETTGRAITGLGFQPDFIWFKSRGSAFSHRLYDTSRGISSTGGKRLFSNTTAAENNITNGQDISAVGTDGFTLGASSNLYTNDANDGGVHVAWCWRANGGTTATNTSGTITTTVQANQAAGFSIITYTGNNGSWGSGNQDTIGHGLSAAPEFMLFKERNATDAWTVFHHNVGAGGGTTAAHNNLRLDTSDALYTNQSYKSFGGVMPTSTVITVEGNTTNESTSTHVAYVWHGIDGFSKFGSYIANGVEDGPFVYTGFRPRLIVFKGISATNNWFVYDTERQTYNPMGPSLEWNNQNAENSDNDDQYRDFDILANGFKIYGNNGGMNHPQGHYYVYAAWGDVPYKYGNSFY